MSTTVEKKATESSPWERRATDAHSDVVRAQQHANDKAINFADNFGGTRFRVAMFGSALVKENHNAMTEALEVGGFCAEQGWDVCTGGGGRTMKNFAIGAQNASHAQGPDRFSISLPLDLPDIETDSFEHDLSLPTPDFGLRLRYFTIMPTAFVAFAGGIGTGLEIFWVAQHIQKLRLAIKHNVQDRYNFLLNPAYRMGYVPRILVVTSTGYYDGLFKLVETWEANDAINPGDSEIFVPCNSLDAVESCLRADHERWAQALREHGVEPSN